MKTSLVTTAQADPYHSPWPWSVRWKSALWSLVWTLTCRWTPKPAAAWRRLVLRVFGSQLHGRPFVHSRARIDHPWNLTLHDRACLGDRAHAYALAPITLESGATVAQEAYLCTGTHDHTDPRLPLQTAPIKVCAHAFVGARAFLLPGVTVGPRAVVGACAVVTRDVPAATTVAGNPARPLSTQRSLP